MSPISWKIRARSPLVSSSRRSSPVSSGSPWVSSNASRSSAMSADGSRLAPRVGVIDDAGRELVAVDESEAEWLVESREVRLAGTNEHRVDHEPVLVDEAAPDELCRERRPADLEVAVDLVPDPREYLADVTLDEPAVPLDLLERRREHEPRRGVPDPGVFARDLGPGGIALAGRPVRGHRLVQAPAVERAVDRP